MTENTTTPAEEVTEDVAVEEVPQVDPTGRTGQAAANGFYWGTGRRKNAVARVRIRPGKGEVVVNGKPLDVYFDRVADHSIALSPLVSLKSMNKVDVFVNTHGGGMTGQAGAIRMGLARALFACYPDSHGILAAADHFTRDSRMVERKKYGRHKARRGHQWGKR
jgi:small subunit ribosomal protein S9